VGNGLRGDTLMVATHEATCRTGFLSARTARCRSPPRRDLRGYLALAAIHARGDAEAQLLLNLSASNITISKVAIGICSAPAILPADDRS